MAKIHRRWQRSLKTINLTGIEDGAGNGTLDVIAAVCGLCANDGAREDYGRAGFALANGTAARDRLAKGHPCRRREAAGHSLVPDEEDVDARIELAIAAQWTRNPLRRKGVLPGFDPGGARPVRAR